MRVGAFYFPTDYGIAIDELARELEARGFESLLVCEHTHIPVSRRTPFPGGGELPKRYSHTHDPFVALSFAAAATPRRCRLPCLTRRRMLLRSRLTARRGSRACCSRCPTPGATMSYGGSTGTRRSRRKNAEIAGRIG
jgi:hypothetical protein